MNEIVFNEKTGKYRLQLSPEMQYWLDPFPEDPLFPFLENITHSDKVLLDTFNDRLLKNYEACTNMMKKIEKNARMRKVLLYLLSALLILTSLNIYFFRNFTDEQLLIFWLIASFIAIYLVLGFIRERQIIPSPLWQIPILAPVELYKAQREILFERLDIIKELENLTNSNT